MKVSKETQYGLRAMVYLAKAPDRIFSLKKISGSEGISSDFLEKIFSKLEKAKLVKAKKGIQGGYFLARESKKITAGEILRALEGTMAPVFCVAKEKEKKFFCPKKRKCLTKNLWKKIQEILNSALDSITLADLIKT